MADQARPPPPVGLPCEAAGSGEFVGNAAAKQDAGQPDAKRMRTMGEAGASPATAAVPQTVGEREETSAGADRALHTEQVGAPTPWPASPKKPPGDASAPVQKKGASAKRPRTNAAAQGMLPGFALPGAFVPAQFAPGMIPWLGVMHQAPAGSSKTSQPLQHQQMVMWQQDQARAMAFWQQQQQKQEKGPKSKSAGIQAKLTKARKLFSRDSRDSPKQQESLVHPSTAGIPAFTSAKGQQQHSTHAVAVMQQSGIGAGDGAAAHAGSMDGMGAESQLPMHDTKLRRIWDKFDEASEDMEKMEAFILEVLADQPTILAAAVDAESGQSIRHATVMRAVCEARPMLNLLVGVLSKYVPVDAWNREVRPMCEQLQSIFGKPGLFCGHAQGAKELKAAELVRNPPENASQRKGRDGRTPKGEGEGFVSMYGKRLVQSCRCDSSKCLKMYCTCFRNGARCNSACVCMECYNDGLHEEERMAAARVYASQIKKPRVESSKLQQQAALLAATQESKKKDKERKRRGRAYTRSQIKAASKFVREYEKKTPNHGAGGEGDAPRCHDIPRTGTFENEETWAAFCALTGEVNHRAINLWDRVQRDMKKAGSAISPAKHMPTNASGAPSAYPQPPAPPMPPMNRDEEYQAASREPLPLSTHASVGGSSNLPGAASAAAGMYPQGAGAGMLPAGVGGLYGHALEKSSLSVTMAADKEARSGLEEARGDKVQAPSRAVGGMPAMTLEMQGSAPQLRGMDEMPLTHAREDVGGPPMAGVGALLHRYTNPSAGPGGVHTPRDGSLNQ